MRRKLNLKISDKRENFDVPRITKPYYLYVEWGNRNFYFSNKKKAERWLAKFRKESSELYREIAMILFDCFKLNMQVTEISHFATSMKYRESLLWHARVYSDNMSRFNTGKVEAGYEIKLLYFETLKQLDYYRSVLRRNNRYRWLYEDVRYNIKKTKRLKRDFDLLLSGADGLKQLSTDEVKTIKYEKRIKVVA